MTVKIDLAFTEQAVLARPNDPPGGVSYTEEVPIPNVGDFIELPHESAAQEFVIVKRTYSYGPDNVVVRLLLDLPPDPSEQPKSSGLLTWAKLGA